MENTPLQNLYDLLSHHDWFYAMSDDGSVYDRGRAAESRLKGLAWNIEGGSDLFNAFAKHCFSGPSWNTEKAPLPPRPGSVITMDDLMFSPPNPTPHHAKE